MSAPGNTAFEWTAVSDESASALRALLVGDMDEHRRRLDLLDKAEFRGRYVPLVTSAFFEAVERRFEGTSSSEVVDWIAHVRATTDSDGIIESEIAERLILWVFDSATTEGIEFEVGYTHQSILLGLLVEELHLDEAGLDDLLQRARGFTDVMLIRQGLAARDASSAIENIENIETQRTQRTAEQVSGDE